MGVVLLILVVVAVVGFFLWKKRNPAAADAAVQKVEDEVKADIGKVKDVFKKK